MPAPTGELPGVGHDLGEVRQLGRLADQVDGQGGNGGSVHGGLHVLVGQWFWPWTTKFGPRAPHIGRIGLRSHATRGLALERSSPQLGELACCVGGAGVLADPR